MTPFMFWNPVQLTWNSLAVRYTRLCILIGRWSTTPLRANVPWYIIGCFAGAVLRSSIYTLPSSLDRLSFRVSPSALHFNWALQQRCAISLFRYLSRFQYPGSLYFDFETDINTGNVSLRSRDRYQYLKIAITNSRPISILEMSHYYLDTDLDTHFVKISRQYQYNNDISAVFAIPTSIYISNQSVSHITDLKVHAVLIKNSL